MLPYLLDGSMWNSSSKSRRTDSPLGTVTTQTQLMF